MGNTHQIKSFIETKRLAEEGTDSNCSRRTTLTLTPGNQNILVFLLKSWRSRHEDSDAPVRQHAVFYSCIIHCVHKHHFTSDISIGPNKHAFVNKCLFNVMMLEPSTTYTPFQIYTTSSAGLEKTKTTKAEKNSNKRPKHKMTSAETIKLVLLDQGTFKLSVGWVTTKSIFHISPLPKSSEVPSWFKLLYFCLSLPCTDLHCAYVVSMSQIFDWKQFMPTFVLLYYWSSLDHLKAARQAQSFQ